MFAPRMGSLSQTTEQPAVPEEATFLSARQFLALATSRKKVLRADTPGRTIRGLLDVETGKRYVIEADQLTQG